MNKVICAVCFLAVIILADAGSTTSPPGTTGAPKSTATPGPPTTHSAAQSTATTAAPSPTTATPPATTPAQTTTTAQVPTSPTSPTPKRNYTARPFSVSDGNKTCILVNLAANFTLSYETAPGVMNQTLIRLDTSQNATGTCGNSKQVITWRMSDPDVTMTWHYTKTGNNNYGVNYTEVTINITQINPYYTKGIVTFTNTTKGLLYSAVVGNSYICNSEGPRNLNAKGNDTVVFRTQNLQSQAFRTVKTMTFSSGQQCPGDLKTSNLVPIAVGAALAGLVIIVLIAYLIGRRKNKRGYESV